MMVLTHVDVPLDIVLVERTVRVSSFKYLKYLLGENDKNSELRTDAVNFRNFDIVRQLSLPQRVEINSTMDMSLYYTRSLPHRRFLNSFIRDYKSVDRRVT